MKHLNYIEDEGAALIDKIKKVPMVLKLFFIAFISFMLLPFTSAA